MSASFKSAFKNWAGITALWAPVYFVLVESFDVSSVLRSELLQWGLVAVGFSGLANIVYTAWKDTRDPAWRAAHRLSPLPAARNDGTAPALTKAELRAGA